MKICFTKKIRLICSDGSAFTCGAGDILHDVEFVNPDVVYRPNKKVDLRLRDGSVLYDVPRGSFRKL